MLKFRAISRSAKTMILCLLMILTITVQTTFAYVVSVTQPVKNTFVPFDSVVGDLILNKTVNHPLGNDYVIPDNISFDFNVNLGAFYANTTLKTTLGEMTTDANGTLTLTVKPGAPVGIEGIDEGTEVTVTEVQKEDDGFAPQDNVETKKISVSKDGSIISFTNVYTPAAVKPGVTLTAVKKIDGLDDKVTATSFDFSFKLMREIDGVWHDLGTKTITYELKNPSAATADFTELVASLSFDKVGIYNFRMTEIEGESDFIKYDKSENYFSIIVGDADMDGKLEVQNVTGTEHTAVTKDDTAGTYGVTVTFTNVYDGTQSPPTSDVSTVLFTVTLTVAILAAAVLVTVRKRRINE